MMQIVEKAELAEWLQLFPQWSLQQGKLRANFQFRDFVQAFGFMTQSALVAETLGHHPEWYNVYNTLRVDLITHDAGPGITSKDLELGQKMSEMYQQFKAIS